MAIAPDTHYVANGDAHIAYQVIGDGPRDLVFFGGTLSHLELIWENPAAARFLERVSSFCRLIMFDKRGVGLSDPIDTAELPPLEVRLDDVRAVMRAAASEEAALFAIAEGGWLAIAMAVTDPARVSGMVLFSSAARIAWAPDYPLGITSDVQDRFLAGTERFWGSERILDRFAPSLKDDPVQLEWWTTFARRSASLGQVLAQARMNYEVDVRHLLPLVQAPTLVLHGEHEVLIPVEHGRYLGEHIPGARYIELPTSDHLPYIDPAPYLLREIREFLTGTRQAFDPDRKLATVLFTDVVDSTARAAQEGDEQWLQLLGRHDQITRDVLRRFRGREVKHTGDGFMAVFDGPARAVRCGHEIAEGVRAAGLEVRVGIHTGEVEMRDDDVGGIAVHIGARVAAAAGPGEVVVSQAVPPLVVGSGLEFSDRGVHELKGVPGEWHLFDVVKPA